MLGTGTQTNPYIISTPQDVDAIRNNLTAYYELANDIDMSSFGNFVPISQVTTFFTGHIDGKGYKIVNLSIISSADFTGFIGRTRDGSISNLGLENVYVESNGGDLGGLAGFSYFVTISNCYVTGTIKQTDSTKYYTGALAGRAYGLIENCFTQCNVMGGKTTGGFVGYSQTQDTIIKNNYSKSTVTGITNVGVFYGAFNTNTGYIPYFVNNFFDKDVAGSTNYQTVGVTSKTTLQMKTQSTFVGWDFDNVWYMDDYPALRVFSNIPSTKKETITVNSSAAPIHTSLNKNVSATKPTESILSPFSAYLNRKTRTNRNVSTYTLPFHTSVSKSNRTVKSSTENVTSFINPVSAIVERHTKTFKNLLSHITPLEGDISVLYPLNTKIANAYVSVLENPSNASMIENMSSVPQVENLSSSHIQFNQSDVQPIVNPSYVEVIE